MLLSIIIYLRKLDDNIKKNIDYLLQQTDQNFEILCLYESNNSNKHEIASYLKEVKNKLKDRLKIIISTSYEGVAYCYNFALTNVEGLYVLFYNSHLHLNKTFVADFQHVLKNLKIQPGLFNLNISDDYYNLYEKDLPMKKNQNLLMKNVLARISPFLGNKLFKYSVIKNNKLFFKVRVNFNSLFVYKFLISCQYVYLWDKRVGQRTSINVSYSLVDLINQWAHIFNLFRIQDIYKTYQDEINYAYFYYSMEFFIKNLNNNASLNVKTRLSNKIYDRLKRRYKYLPNNKYFLNSKNSEFVEHVNNIENYFKQLKK